VSSVVNSFFSDGGEDNAFYVMNWEGSFPASDLWEEFDTLAFARGTDDGVRPYTSYSPPTVRPSMRIVGAATEPRNSRSLAISEMLKNRSFRFPATVISSTG
jgi:hypothetical protein